MSLHNETLFDNSMVREAKRHMTPEMLAQYAEIGKQMYNFDFEQEVIPLETQIRDALEYIFLSLRCGLHPSYLSDSEIELLTQEFGNAWYTQLGLTESDLLPL